MSEQDTRSAIQRSISIQRVITCLAAGRCYACGWPLAATKDDGCVPFNCAMRYKDDTQHLAERENWHARAKEMNDVLGWAVGESTEALPSQLGESERDRLIEMCARVVVNRHDMDSFADVVENIRSLKAKA